MNFSVIPSDKFKKETKRLVKKFPSLKQELADISTTLANEPEAGTPLGNNTYNANCGLNSVMSLLFVEMYSSDWFYNSSGVE